MADIRKQLGLDFLRRGQDSPDQSARQTPSTSSQAFLDEALIAYGRRFLEALQGAAPGTLTVFALLDRLNVDVDVARKVVEYLEERKYLEVVRRDRRGDHELRITDAGARLLAA